MHASVRFYQDGPVFEAAMRRIEVGIVPLWQRLPGFGAAYSLHCATGLGLGITLFDSAETLAAANATAAAWGATHLTDLAAGLKPSELCSCRTLFAITAAGAGGRARRLTAVASPEAPQGGRGLDAGGR
jgi:hypothetical protein